MTGDKAVAAAGSVERREFTEGDAIVVTGAAQGIGRAIAVRLARMGARLSLWDIKTEELAQTADLCRAAGAEIRCFDVDVSQPDQVTKAAAETKAAFGAVFGLVNNAGIYPRAPAMELSAELWHRVLDVNLFGYLLGAQALGPSMLEAGRGAIVNIASGTALRGAVRGAHYAASKAGIVSLTKSLALELAPSVRVNCIIPGITETAQPLGDMSLQQLVAIGETLPLGRAGRPEDIAGVAAFLVGPDAGYITGQSIAVNGGAVMIP